MRVAVFGGGYAGVATAHRLEERLPPDVDLVVVDDTGTHLLQHELHRVIRRPSLADTITIPLGDVLACPVTEARVLDVDPEAAVATLEDPDQADGTSELRYDVGVVSLGATPADHGLPGVAEHGTPLKSLADARAIRADFLDLDSGDTVLVGGGGLAGVQVAGELAALASERATAPEIVLLEQRETVPPGFSSDFQRAVRGALERAGVEVRTGVAIEAAHRDSVELAPGGSTGVAQFVWTGGIRGSAAMDGDRPTVRSDLRVTDSTFLVGDAGTVVDREGRLVQPSAQAAVRAGRVAARNAAAVVRHRRDEGGLGPALEKFSFDPSAWVVTVGDEVLAQVRSRVLTGAGARATRTLADAQYLASIGEVRTAIETVRDTVGRGPDVAERDDADAT